MKVFVTKDQTKLQYKASTGYDEINVGANLHNPVNEKTFRPMELILVGLASCSAIDIENILTKQRFTINHLSIETTGNRADKIPAVFDNIELDIQISTNATEEKIQKAINLTKDKYCSVYKMLIPSVNINYNVQFKNF